MNSLPPQWILPAWPLAEGVMAVCTTREGGRSRGPFDSLNLGDHVGDERQAVAANRATVGAALGARPVFLKQVHGTATVRLDTRSPQGTQADACVTTERAVACAIMVADCLPVLMAHDSGLAVGAAHAGWRGLAQGVLDSALQGLAQSVGQSPDEAASFTRVWLGPCIGPRAFEVGGDVKAAFEAGDRGASACFAPHTPGKWLADLPGLARRRLAALGVTQIYGNDGSDAWCTVSQPSRFFSHRRDRSTGRFAAFIWRR